MVKVTSEHFYKFIPIIDGIADRVSESRLIADSRELHGGFDECFRLMGSSLQNLYKCSMTYGRMVLIAYEISI